MQKGIVTIHNDDLWVGTFDISKGFGLEHRYIKILIEKYKSHFEEFGNIKRGKRNAKNELYFIDDSLLSTTTSASKNTLENDVDSLHKSYNESINDFLSVEAKSPKKKSGGQVEEYVINEAQCFFLGTLCKNSNNIMEFKKTLTKEFFRMRKVLIKLTVQKQNEDWHSRRAAGIVERRVETDAIQDFILYAKEQGSQSADKYYMIISKMQNQSLLHLELLGQKYENMRDSVDGFDLDALKMADKIVAQAVREGIKNKMHYKDIYLVARDRVEGFSMAIGRSPLRLMNQEKK